MKIANFDLERDILVIAEIGNNHEGSYNLAVKLVKLAAQAGVGAVKFQVFKTEDYINRKDKKRFRCLKSFELNQAQFEKLSLLAQRLGLLFIATPFDLSSVKFLKKLVSAYKISSGDNTFYPLIEAIADTGKPIILSSGLCDIKQLKYVQKIIKNKWKALGIKQTLVILNCISAYPVPPQEANLAAILEMKKKLNCLVGYSDHTIGIEAAALSVALGACIVEKHFTIDHHYSDFRDHRLSANFKEMSLLVKRVKNTVMLLGDGKKRIQNCERSCLDLLRRSIVAKRPLSKGSMISWEDLTWTRPAGGLSPGQEPFLIGKILKEDVRAGDFLLPTLVQE